MAKVSCLRCKHYYNTWNPDIPRGCRAFNFQSKQIPSIIVKAESGEDCMKYEERAKKKKDGMDLNDESLW